MLYFLSASDKDGETLKTQVGLQGKRRCVLDKRHATTRRFTFRVLSVVLNAQVRTLILFTKMADKVGVKPVRVFFSHAKEKSLRG